jgi:hypothetical protein
MSMLRNTAGRRVIVRGDLMKWYVDVHGYTMIDYIGKGEGTKPGWVAVVRELGGLGDVICVQSVVAGLQERGLKVAFYTPKVFWPVCIADELLDTTRVVPHGPAAPEMRFKTVYSMFCPAGDHEGMTGMRPTAGRIRNFCGAAEVPPRKPPISRLVKEAYSWNEPGLHIGFQPLSENRTKDLDWDYAEAIVNKLAAAGANVHVFHHKPLPGRFARARQLWIAPPMDQLRDVVASLDAMVSIDSGLLHLPAALDVPTVGIFGVTNGPLTCEFYPSVSVFQCDRPDGDTEVCHTPCYYSHVNKYHCMRRPGSCMYTVDVNWVVEEALRRASGRQPRHRISEHWLTLNSWVQVYHGGIENV